MKKNAFRNLILGTLLWTGCSSNYHFEQSPSVDFTPFKTYAFLPKVESSKFPGDNNHIIDELIERIISTEMNNRNYTVNTPSPDLGIQFHLIVEPKDGLIYPTSGPPMSHSYMQGTLVIGIFDQSTGKLIWKGWTIEKLYNVGKFEQRLPDVVQQVLKNFPERPK
jgi:Domain of unknown function (DUF4136)